jgi:hypothetical protein
MCPSERLVHAVHPGRGSSVLDAIPNQRVATMGGLQRCLQFEGAQQQTPGPASNVAAAMGCVLRKPHEASTSVLFTLYLLCIGSTAESGLENQFCQFQYMHMYKHACTCIHHSSQCSSGPTAPQLLHSYSFFLLHLSQAVCPQGYTCVRMDEWYSQCRPAQTEVTPRSVGAKLLEASAHSGQPTGQAAQAKTLGLWLRCGGVGSCGFNSPCSDATWTTVRACSRISWRWLLSMDGSDKLHCKIMLSSW